MTTARQLFKLAHRAARTDFYAVGDFPGMGRSAQHAVSASCDHFVQRARGEAASLQALAAQRRAMKALPTDSLFADL